MQANPIIMGHIAPLTAPADADVAEMLNDGFTAFLHAARLLNYGALALALLACACLFLKSAVRRAEDRAYDAGRADEAADELARARRGRAEEDYGHD